MRIVSIALVLLALAAPALAQPSATVGSQLAWDAAISDLPFIARFELQIDGGPWVSQGLPSPQNDGNTTVAHNTYRSAPLTADIGQGPHTFAVRSCAEADSETCVSATPVAFGLFTFGPPVNLRIIPPSSGLTTPPPPGD